MEKMSFMSLLLWLIATCLLSWKAEAEIYYYIDFSSPLHTVGQPPTMGNSTDTISTIKFGQPVVSDSLGVLQDQPLVFNSSGNIPAFYYDQIQLVMDYGTGFYYTSFDMTTRNLIGSKNAFAILFDSPLAQNIRLTGNGEIEFFGKARSHYLNNQLLHFEVFMDMSLKNTRVLLNGSEVFNETLNIEYMRAIRFSHGLNNMTKIEDNTSYVGIDNILVADEVIPEPASLLLLGLGGMLIRKR